MHRCSLNKSQQSYEMHSLSVEAKFHSAFDVPYIAADVLKFCIFQVSLQPDHTKRAHWRTAVVKSSRNPDFDHKFSFELMPEDTTKRLLVTVWHRDFENKCSELLGSMSFGMGKILNSDQYVKGWYRLLRQDLGMRRHFAARCLRGTCPRAKSFHAD